MSRFFLQLSYNGKAYNGWQVQENSANTIQQVIEDKLSMLLKEPINLVGCGRTDTGVNARNFMAHFDSRHDSLVLNKTHWIYKFNTVLPPDIAIQDILPVQDNAHARYDATERMYYYFISRVKNPFRDAFTWQVHGELDFELMNKGAAMLLEYDDFTSFSKLHTQNKTNICRLSKAVWQVSGENEWRFSIRANRFLRGMVRSLVGTLVMLGKNKISLQDLRIIIESKDRSKAGSNAPAHALFLTGIHYPQHLFLGKQNA
ncbi:MAG TPA: tRNA pseudouridine(38-40) synthase TruA [Bacteroidia bacterium]|nr:tRNA pseudouridine(38-40) synthase TruA [Bacteroidia bacterium]